LRRFNGVSQNSLAIALGVNRNNIASYESGSVEPNAQLFLRTCDYFQTTPQEMLETIMSENPVESTNLVIENLDKENEHVVMEHLDQFISQTNEMTKMFEGYSTLIELRKSVYDDVISKELYSTFTDLLELLESLIKLNWDVIHTIIPSDL